VGETQTPGGAARACGLDLFREQAFQDHRRRRVLIVEMVGQAFRRGRHPEVVEVASKPLVGGLAHAITRS
jgi:hypothetical protein